MFGSLDGSLDLAGKPYDEAQELRDTLVAVEAAKKRTWGDTWSDIRNIPATIGGMAKGLVAPALPNASGLDVPYGAAFGTLSPGEAAVQPESVPSRATRGLINAGAEAVASGATAPGDALAGKILQYGADGVTSPDMIRRGFDMASIAGGGSVAGAAEAAPAKAVTLAADSARAAAPIAVAEHATPSGLRIAPNLERTMGKTTSYDIHAPDGSVIGNADFKIEGNKAHVLDIATDQFNANSDIGAARNSIGPAAMRDLLAQFRDLHPDVEVIGGKRISGARQGGGYGEGGADVTIPLPERAGHNPVLQDAFKSEMGDDAGNAAYEAYLAAHGEAPKGVANVGSLSPGTEEKM